MDRNPTNPTDPTRTTLDDVWHHHHGHLVGLASKMLADPSGAEDVVQEAFGRLLGADLDQIDDVRAWLTVVVRRLCLNRVQSAYARRESVAGAAPPEPGPSLPGLGAADPADRVTLDGQIQLALAVVLKRLTPAERSAFVLHDVFGFPFAVIGEIVGRSPTACRQLASRARRSIRSPSPGSSAWPTEADMTDDHGILTERFISACAGGDIAELLEVLDPSAVGEAFLSDGRRIGHAEGAEDVAATAMRYVGPDSGMVLVPVPIEGGPGIVAVDREPGGPAAMHTRVRVVMRLEVEDGVIRHLHAFVIPPGQRD
jgi:RNA polymerase sigma-70 factor (ECF subfamily)